MVKKYLFVGLGFVFFALGAIGTLLPVLPTTPFLLAAAFFFAKGSEKFNNWFLSTKLYKNHLESFISERAMTFKTKACILGFASTMLIIAFVSVDNIIVKGVIAFAFFFKYYYFIFHIRTIKEDEKINN
ncbi:YbaN family protein [Sedimentibacter sp.]|uniref:YbaN family protein n=1 Tax=Sedimentibacter sp. TaxID=1960295 RepID=UPI0028980C6E|nr:YbaN family protein [Sedimentibacter sp.]